VNVDCSFFSIFCIMDRPRKFESYTDTYDSDFDSDSEENEEEEEVREPLSEEEKKA